MSKKRKKGLALPSVSSASEPTGPDGGEFPDCQVVEWFPRPRVEPGLYRARFVRYETAVIFNDSKVILYFKIVSPGPYHGQEIARIYRAQSLSHKKRRRSGAFTASPGQEIYKDRCRLFGAPERRDRFNLSPFQNRTFMVEVDQVTTDYRQTDLPPECWYSKVGEIVSVEKDS